MIQTVEPGPRYGNVEIPASKSVAHRLLICAALYGNGDVLKCNGISRDILATMNCLTSMGAKTERNGNFLMTRPVTNHGNEYRCLSCGESGSTLRFLLPVVGALGMSGEFLMEGRLPERPLQPLWDLLENHGMRLRKDGCRLYFSGRLEAGEYVIPGNISSQYISGLLLALPLLNSGSILRITHMIESADYIVMTEKALKTYHVDFKKRDGRTYLIEPAKKCVRTPMNLTVESDWSSAAFFLSMGALSHKGIVLQNMNISSGQGDRKILELLRNFGAEVIEEQASVSVRRNKLQGQKIDASDIPDLIPVLAAVASVSEGQTVIDHAERLRLKESDRLKTTTEMLRAIGADIQETGDGLIIQGKTFLNGGTVKSSNDHRIAMSAAVAASVCRESVTITDAECTEKSFPGFWNLLSSLKKEGK